MADIWVNLHNQGAGGRGLAGIYYEGTGLEGDTSDF